MDALIEAIVNLEVAVDDYAHGVYVNVTNPDPEDVPVAALRTEAIVASTLVAQAMTDGDIGLVDAVAAAAVIPHELHGAMAAAEIAHLRRLQGRVAYR